MAKTFYFTQEILNKVYFPEGGWAKGRFYYWMKDVDGTVYLAGIEDDGVTPKIL